MMRLSMKEIGSFWHFNDEFFKGKVWLPKSSKLFGSGRDALRAIVSYGKSQGWKRIWIPTYYCHDVTDSISKDIDVFLYDSVPFDIDKTITIANDEAIVIVEYFGLRAGFEISGGSVILDRTHDPYASWCYAREPDYKFASLRKALPLPVGGIVWPQLECMFFLEESDTSVFHEDTVEKMTVAMLLKSLYLSGVKIEKSTFLELARDSEMRVAQGNLISGPSILSRILIPLADMNMLQDKRLANIAYMDSRLKDINMKSNIKWIPTPAYGILLCADIGRRDKLKNYLIQHGIYPAILWPLDREDIPIQHKILSDTIIVLHADARYTLADMEYVVDEVLTGISGA